MVISKSIHLSAKGFFDALVPSIVPADAKGLIRFGGMIWKRVR